MKASQFKTLALATVVALSSVFEACSPKTSCPAYSHRKAPDNKSANAKCFFKDQEKTELPRNKGQSRPNPIYKAAAKKNDKKRKAHIKHVKKQNKRHRGSDWSR